MKLLIIEDEFLVRKGTAMTLRELNAPNAVIAEATSLASAFDRLDGSPDIQIIFLDLGLPDSSGLETLKRLHHWCETRRIAAKIVVLSAIEEPAMVRTALETGASGFIVKRAVQDDNYAEALTRCLKGQVWLPKRSSVQPRPGRPRKGFLTKREIETCNLLRKCTSYLMIAQRLKPLRGKQPTDDTVRRHITNVAEKLGLEGPPKSAVMIYLSDLDVSDAAPLE